MISNGFKTSVLDGVLCTGAAVLDKWLSLVEEQTGVLCDEGEDDQEAVDAAALLGVEPDASADEIRAALRRRMSEERAHPDHGGDEETAKRLIGAKNLLIERLGGAP
jgi:hypothetical protein